VFEEESGSSIFSGGVGGSILGGGIGGGVLGSSFLSSLFFSSGFSNEWGWASAVSTEFVSNSGRWNLETNRNSASDFEDNFVIVIDIDGGTIGKSHVESFSSVVEGGEFVEGGRTVPVSVDIFTVKNGNVFLEGGGFEGASHWGGGVEDDIIATLELWPWNSLMNL
jgi:hypothetical protein